MPQTKKSLSALQSIFGGDPVPFPRKTMKPVYPEPEFAPIGGEDLVNAARPAPVRPAANGIYEELMKRFGGRGPELQQSQNPIDILKNYARRNTPQVSPEMQSAHDLQVIEEQAQQPLYKQVGRNLMDAVVDFANPFSDPGADASIGSKIGALGANFPMMGMAKRAGKGLTKGIQGFELPDGRVAMPDASGVNQIIEGTDAVDALRKMQTPTISQQNRTSGFVPVSAGPHELPDVAVPIPDSLDTAATSKLPLTQEMFSNQKRSVKASRARSKVADHEIFDIRDLYDTGSKLHELEQLYPNLNKQTVHEIAKRLSFATVQRPKK